MGALMVVEVIRLFCYALLLVYVWVCHAGA
jgi:hypothetical protein